MVTLTTPRPEAAITWAGSAPLDLAQVSGPLVVEAGSVEVFAVPAGTTGPRTHLATVPAGGLVWGLGGLPEEHHGLTLLAVGTATARLKPTDGELTAGLDGWVKALTGGLGHHGAGVGPAGPSPRALPWAEAEARGAGARLREFHHALFTAVTAELERRAAVDRERLAQRQERDRATLSSAYAHLATLLLPEAERALSPAAEADPLVVACRRAGAALGIEIHDRPASSPLGKQGDALAKICAAAHIRARRVLLRDAWWKGDNGPLVAFRSASEARAPEPVALLPTSVASYALVAADGTATAVDARVAEALSGDAYMLYPALPARPVHLGDLARMAFAGRRRDVATLILMGLAGGLLGLFLPILTGQVFGNLIPGAERGRLLEVVLALFASALASAAFQMTRSLAVLRLGGKVDGLLQAAVWDRLLALPVTFFRRYTVGDLANRALGIDTIRELLTGNVLTVTLSAVFSVASFALLFSFSLRLALFATALAFALLLVTAGLAWWQLRHQRTILDRQGKIASLVFGLIQGIGKLRVARAEARAFARWAERFAEQRRSTLAAQRAANLQTTFNAVYPVLTSLGIFAMVGATAREDLPLGEFLAFNAAFGQFLAAVLSLVSVFSSVLAAIPVYERLRPILETVPEVDASKAEPGELSGAIEFSHVSFRYGNEGPLVLDDVSFHARAGEFIALVGPSGAGKSTCLRLILGFEKPSAGSIYFDGQDLAGIAVQSVRRQIGVVLQTGKPLSGSIYSNIVGSANLTMDDAWEAARAAGLEEDIKAMPMGMHTVVSEGAETFSGGQKQRILIARAIVHRPRILLFDEATSALDNHTQETVSKSLERLKATRIVIAHRLSTIQNADRIYVIDGGRVVEQGTFAELLQKGGPFTRLAERQIA